MVLWAYISPGYGLKDGVALASLCGGYMISDPIPRFWSHVDKSGGPDACWPWTGHLYARGRGTYRYHGQVVQPHRLAYSLTHGTPPSKHLRRVCEMRHCCNPDHYHPTDHNGKSYVISDDGTTARVMMVGKIYTLDSSDLPRVIDLYWYAVSGGYICVHSRVKRVRGRGQNVYLAKVILDDYDPLMSAQHTNGDKMDYRRSNLELVPWDVAMYSRPSIWSKSGYRGVMRSHASPSRWLANIQHHGEKIYLGCFTSPEDAARAFDAKAVELRGLRCVLNFPEDYEK